MSRTTPLTIAIVAALALVPAASTADTIHVGDSVKIVDVGLPRHSDLVGGGAFELQNLSGGSSFITYCLEQNELLGFGTAYWVAGIGPAAVAGGVGGAVDGSDEISVETRYVYFAYRMGQTSGWGDGWDEATVQEVIWYLEDELVGPPPTPITLAAQAIVDDAQANAAAFDFGGYVVQAVNVVDDAGAGKQDVLTLRRVVPEPGMLALLGLGALGFVALRRRAA